MIIPDTAEAQIDRIEAKVDRLVSIVEGLLGGIAEAQNSGGMSGMMMRQMNLPDATAILNNKG
jgi:hypothetical protein